MTKRQITKQNATRRRDMFASLIATCVDEEPPPSGVLRTLANCWYCYDRYARGKNTFLNANGNPYWLNYKNVKHIKIENSFDQFSAKAVRYFKRNDLSKLKIEHAIPIKVIEGLLLKKKKKKNEITTADVNQVLTKYFRLALICKSEDASIQRGFQSSMPTGWDKNPRKPDLYARYASFSAELSDSAEDASALLVKGARPAPSAGAVRGQ